jgi:hypothetical protein
MIYSSQPREALRSDMMSDTETIFPTSYTARVVETLDMGDTTTGVSVELITYLGALRNRISTRMVTVVADANGEDVLVDETGTIRRLDTTLRFTEPADLAVLDAITEWSNR